jgi:tripartite-type tricarboxylate transporter receptor subunit TctC
MLLGGQVDFAWSGGVHQRYGDKIRVLASCNSERLPQSPEAPALMEKYGIAMPGRVIIMGPKGIPDDRIEVLQAALKKATNDPAFIKMLKENLKFPQMFIAGEEVKKSLPGIIKKLEDMKEKMGM